MNLPSNINILHNNFIQNSRKKESLDVSRDMQKLQF